MVRCLRLALPLLAVCLMANSAVFAQGQGRGRGGFGGGMFGGGGMGGGVGFLLMSPQVQKELKMTDEQTAKVGEIQREQSPAGGGAGGGGRANFQNMTEEERTKFFEDMRKRAEESGKKMTAVLSADQNARLKQIQLWVAGVAGLPNNADAAKELGITDDQKEAFKTISEESGKKFGELFQQGGFGPNASDEDRKKMQDKMAEIRKDTESECMAVLTDEQKAKLTKMRGEKFELDMTQMGRGGFGGGGRRGRPGNNNN